MPEMLLYNQFQPNKISTLTVRVVKRKQKLGLGLLQTQPAIACSKLTIETLKRRSGVFIVNFEHISHLVLVFLLLTLSK